MALLQGLEVYIPQEAEVRSVPLRSLPGSVLRKIGPSADLPDSSRCVWISPALFQRKGQKDRGGARQHMLTELRKGQGSQPSAAKGSTHWKMYFVTANVTAYRVLKETLPEPPTQTRVFSEPSAAKVPQGPVSDSEQDAIIIHRGRIYLSVKRKKHHELPSLQRPIVSLQRLSLPLGPTAQGPTAQGPTAQGPTPQGPTAQGPTAQGPTAQGPTAQGPTAQRPTPQRPTVQGPTPQGPTAARSPMASVIRNELKRKLSAKLSDRAQGRRGTSPQVSPQVSQSPEAGARASRSQGAAQRTGRSQGAAQASSRTRDTQGPDLSREAGLEAGRSQEASRSQGSNQSNGDPQIQAQEPGDQSPAPHSPAQTWGPPELPALPEWGPWEPSARQQDFDFEELARRERIAQMTAMLQKSDSEISRL